MTADKLSEDIILREKIRRRDKAVRDYENDMAVAREEGIMEGISKGRKEMKSEFAENMRRNGFTEDQIKPVPGDDFDG